ncbi:hypothetical protein GRAN_4736 [Granulicella sibirica]|uniref:Uncharacterized protein n=1 Tax=Granulicella sibirica TaxID=2479048 RepID=A0A4Q0SWW2_9BACT|nr:hypothetical protein GRAN_4736 [Granulicella sibirica]
MESAVEAMKALPWVALQEMKGNATVLQKLEEAENLLKSLRRALAKE